LHLDLSIHNLLLSITLDYYFIHLSQTGISKHAGRSVAGVASLRHVIGEAAAPPGNQFPLHCSFATNMPDKI